MKTALQTVTPAKAAQWLSAHINRDNRALRDHAVSYLANEIKRGKWQTTHQGIAFSTAGRLLDGQHRLAAIVKSNQPVQMMVTTDLDEDSFRVIDCGMKRANHDRIHLVDDPAQNRTMCAAIRCFLTETQAGSNAVSVSLIEDEFLKNADHWMWAVSHLQGRSQKLNRPSVMAAIAVYHLVKPLAAEEFITGFINGDNLPAGSPVLKLRTIALSGTHMEATYWRCQAAMRAHLNGATPASLFAASEDMVGNTNTSRVVKARSAVRRVPHLKKGRLAS